MKSHQTPDNLIQVLTATEARKALGNISRATEHRWQVNGILKPRRIGTRKLYLLEEINELILKGAA